jgi:AcrR family transcriptional regulator
MTPRQDDLDAWGRRRLRVREAQKQATRRRVLDAARDLFDDVGFEATTVRAIAQKAGVSVGSVFTTFSSKADILSEVMQDRLEDLYGELERVMPLLRGSTADRVRSLYALHCDFEMRRPKLFLAHIAAAYNPELEPSTIPAGRNKRLRSMVIETMRQGQARGDVCPEADLELAMELIHSAYMWNYTAVAGRGAGTQDLIAAMDRQIGQLFDGLTPRK